MSSPLADEDKAQPKTPDHMEEKDKQLAKEAYQKVRKDNEAVWSSWTAEKRELAAHKYILLASVQFHDYSKLPAYLAEIVKQESIDAGQDIRVRDIEYGILSTSRIDVGTELDVLKGHVKRLFCWFTDDKIKQTYAAPCMPIIQSSGTGKTKLLAELREHAQRPKRENQNEENEDDDYQVVLVSCVPRDERRDSNRDPNRCVFDKYLDIKGGRNSDTQFLSKEFEPTLRIVRPPEPELPIL